MRVRRKLDFLGNGLGLLTAFGKRLAALGVLTPAAAGLGGRGCLSRGSLGLSGLGTGFAFPTHSIQMTSQSVNRKTDDIKDSRTVPEHQCTASSQPMNCLSDRSVRLQRRGLQADDPLRRDIRTNGIPSFETGKIDCEY